MLLNILRSINDLQISSIFRGLAKNHAFSNGNKRTAIRVYDNPYFYYI